MIDLAMTEPRGRFYYIGSASLYTGEFFCMKMEDDIVSLVHKMTLREPSIATFLVKYIDQSFWSTGDDCCLNKISFF